MNRMVLRTGADGLPAFPSAVAEMSAADDTRGFIRHMRALRQMQV
jgi:hypothetical protein